MENFTPIPLQSLDTEALAERAVAIRDAVQAKTVSAAQVGSLFMTWCSVAEMSVTLSNFS